MYFLNRRFTRWALIPHFSIDLKTHTAHIVSELEIEQSLLSIIEYELLFFFFSIGTY
jgi:hypothetical protein